MEKALSLQDFRKMFKTVEECLNYLMEMKWGGFKCNKCGFQII